MKTVDVGAAIDEGRWTGYQKLLIFGKQIVSSPLHFCMEPQAF